MILRASTVKFKDSKTGKEISINNVLVQILALKSASSEESAHDFVEGINCADSDIGMVVTIQEKAGSEDAKKNIEDISD